MCALHTHRDKPAKPFRCLNSSYRRELVRVYLSNVEGVCRRFCDDKRARLAWVRDHPQRFKDFWKSLPGDQQRQLLTEKADVILKVRRHAHTCKSRAHTRRCTRKTGHVLLLGWVWHAV